MEYYNAESEILICVKIRHSEPAMIKRIIDAYLENRLFSEFIRCPDELLEPPPHNENYELFRERMLGLYGSSTAEEWKLNNDGSAYDRGVSEERNSLRIVDQNTLDATFCMVAPDPTRLFDRWIILGCEVTGQAVLDEEGIFIREFGSKKKDTDFLGLDDE